MAKRFRRTLEKAAFCFILVFMLGLLLGQKTVVAKPTVGSMMLATGEQKKAKIYLLPKGAKVTWSIEDSSIAKMEKGKVTALQEGNTTIAATIRYKEKNKTVKYVAKAELEVIAPRETGTLFVKEPEKTVYLRYPDAYNYSSNYENDKKKVEFRIDVSKDNELDTEVFNEDEDIAYTYGSGAFRRNDYVYTMSASITHAGSSHIILKDKYGKTCKLQVNVLAYENPLKSVYISNVEGGQNLAAKLNDRAWYYGKNYQLLFTKKTAKPTISLEAAKNWEITSVKTTVQRLKRKDKGDVTWRKNLQTQNVTIRLPKAAVKKDRIKVEISLVNKQNGAEQTITLGDNVQYW